MFKNLRIIQKVVMLAGIIIVVNLVLQTNFILKMREADISTAKQNALSEVLIQSKNYEAEFRRIENIVKGYSESYSKLIENKEMTRATAIKILEESLRQNPSVVGHGLGFEKDGFDGSDSLYKGQTDLGANQDGRFLPYISLDNNNLKVESLTGYDVPGEGDWYLVPKETGKPIITEPYIYPVNGKDVLMFTISYPVKKGNDFIGVVTADIALGKVDEMLKNDKDKAEFNLESSMITQKGMVIGTTADSIRKDKEVSSKSIFKTIEASKGAFVQFDNTPWVKGKQLVGAAPITFNSDSNKWFIVNLVPEKQILANYTHNLRINLIVILVSLIIIGLVVYFIQRSINTPMNKLLKVIRVVDEGDLTQKTELDTKDELGELSRNFDHMIENMKNLIYNVKKSSNVVGESAEKMGNITYESVRSITNVNTVVSQIAEAHSKQSEDIEEIVQKTALLSNLISDTGIVIEEVSTISEKTQEVSNNGINILEELNKKTKNTMDKSEEISLAVEEVNTSVGNINTITTIIEQIASKTNLLALNASIEAARAGESGKGFAVVAEEIRKLAEQTSEATKDINKVIELVVDKSINAVEAVGEVKTAQELQFESIKESATIFREINESFTTLKEKIAVVDQKTVIIERSKTEILDAVTNISAVSQETTASTEETTSMMNEQKEAIDELNDYSNTLNKLTHELLDYVNEFKVD